MKLMTRSSKERTTFGWAVLLFAAAIPGAAPLAVAAPPAEIQARRSAPVVVRIDTLRATVVDTLRTRIHTNFDSLRRARPKRRVHPIEAVRRHSMDARIDELRAGPAFAEFRRFLAVGALDSAGAALQAVADTTRGDPVVKEVAAFDLVELALFGGDIDVATEGYAKFAKQYRRGYLTNDAISRGLLIRDNLGGGHEPLQHYGRAAMWLRLAAPDSALAACRALLGAFPDGDLKDDVYLMMGDAAVQTATPETALPFYQALVDSLPETPHQVTAQMRIGHYYSDTVRDVPRAIAAYEEVLVRFPESLEAAEARKILQVLNQET